MSLLRKRTATWLAGAAAAAILSLSWLATTAEAHPPIGYRVAVGSARVAARSAYVARRAPIAAARVTYRAAATPIYPHYYHRHAYQRHAYRRPVVGYPSVVRPHPYVRHRSFYRSGYHY